MKRTLWLRLAVITLLMLAAGPALAQNYPNKPITIVCWSNPGSPNDLFARQIAKIGQKYFRQPINVLTKSGGDGAIAMAYLVSQRPDGYTLSTITSSQTFGMAYGLIPFRPQQFTDLIRVQEDPFVIAVPANSPFKDLNGFFAYANKNPGKLTIAGFGTASAHFLAFAELKSKAGNPDIRWIAYEGGGDAIVAGLGGHVDAVHTNFSVAREHFKAGKLRALGVSPARLPQLPNVKSYSEQGYDITPIQWRGLMGPAGMANEVVARVRELLDKTVADPEFKAYLQNSGDQFAAMEAPAAFQRLVEEEVKKNQTLIKALSLRR
jgi:tripartite-type tricarboxylate transporter receptor subunit TctC